MVEEDFLENDDEIRGQNYTCMSFLSPEEVLKNKEVFFVHCFLKTMAKNYDLDENTIQEKYKDFMYVNSDKLEKQFLEDNDFRTTVRGIKIRGTYDTLKEAQVRAKVLQKRDKNHNVYVGQVGYWLPWDPSSHKIENQEYGDNELNNLMKEYKSNIESKEQHFQENIEYVKEQANSKREKEEKEKKEKIEKDLNKVSSENLSSKMDLEGEDVWLSSKGHTDNDTNNDTNNDTIINIDDDSNNK